MAEYTKSIFQTRINYNDLYPKYKEIKEFDMHHKQLLYGRIDRDGDAIYLHDANLDQIWTGQEGTELALDFVCEAFDWLKNHILKVANGGGMDTNSLFTPAAFRARKAYRAGDLEHSYYHYLKNLYTDFVQNYLEVNRRYEEVSDFNSFLISFSKYMSSIAYYFPLTKTGYLLSNHCSPYVSGMMVDIAPEKYGMKNSKKAIKYTTDSNFLFIKKAAKKFGFMMDKHAPWRLVFNVASGGLKEKYELTLQAPPTNEAPWGVKIPKDEKELAGAAYFMGEYGVSFSRTPVLVNGFLQKTKQSNHVFDAYFIKAHMMEIENLRKNLFLFYDAFYTQFKSYTKIETPMHLGDVYQTLVMEERERERCRQRRIGQLQQAAKLKLKYFKRLPLPGMPPKQSLLPENSLGLAGYMTGTPDSLSSFVPDAFNQIYTDRFWLNYILKFRLLETASPHDIHRYKFFQKQMLDNYSAFGTKAALNYINDLTKGFFETKFIQEGDYWYGNPKTMNEARRDWALKNVGSDAYELTGVLNKFK